MHHFKTGPVNRLYIGREQGLGAAQRSQIELVEPRRQGFDGIHLASSLAWTECPALPAPRDAGAGRKSARLASRALL